MQTMNRFNFSPASKNEEFVHGAQRPGYSLKSSIPDSEVGQWVEFMRQQGIARVCCLLEEQLSFYQSDLLASCTARRALGEPATCLQPGWSMVGKWRTMRL